MSSSGRTPMKGRKEDSGMIRGLREQLARLQDKRRELESRRIQEEEEALRRPILPHLTEMMRDRELAQVRLLVQRNMTDIDKEIQEAIRRIGLAMLDTDGDPIVSSEEQRPPIKSPDRVRRNYPDLVPGPAALPAPHHHHPPGSLPPSGSQSRRNLLEAVKETLSRQKILIKLRPHPMEEPLPAGSPTKSPRVGLYSFQHPEEEASQAKLARLTVQQLPSVTIASRRPAIINRAQVIDVQSSSTTTTTTITSPEVEVTEEVAGAEADPQSIIRAEDVARVVSDILAEELDLAFEVFDAIHEEEKRAGTKSSIRGGDMTTTRFSGSIPAAGPHAHALRTSTSSPSNPAAASEEKDRGGGKHAALFLLGIDTATQTPVPAIRTGPALKDSSTAMDPLRTESRAVGPDDEDPPTMEGDLTEEEEEEEGSLTPPRSRITMPAQDAPDLDLWRRRYPPSPPESLIKDPEHDLTTETEVTTTTSSNNSGSRGTRDGTTTSSSDATGISTSSAGTSVGGLSWLSEGEVPIRVGHASPGLVPHQLPRTSVLRNPSDRSEATLSEGQVLLQLSSTPIEGSSEGEILVPPGPVLRSSDSTASFQSAASGSDGEVDNNKPDEEEEEDESETE